MQLSNQIFFCYCSGEKAIKNVNSIELTSFEQTLLEQTLLEQSQSEQTNIDSNKRG
jgi:hypothetical protein